VPKTVDTADVHALVERDAQLIEVPPTAAYEREHLTGAISLPLAEITPRIGLGAP
jgi:hypothetical protein